MHIFAFRMSKHEKTKSGGLLESWFGRPKPKSANYNTGTLSGRPTSAEGDAAFDLQELERTIRGLSDSEVDIKFMEILEDMNIPKDKRGPLLSKSITERQKMIFMHLKGECFFFCFFMKNANKTDVLIGAHLYFY